MHTTGPADLTAALRLHLNRGDVPAAAALFAVDALLVLPDGAAHGADAIGRRLRALADAEFAIERSETAVHGEGETAILYDSWRGTRRGPCGDRLGVEGRAVAVARQDDGAWRFIALDLFGPNAAAAS